MTMKDVYVTYTSFMLQKEWLYHLFNFVEYLLFLLIGLLIFEGWNAEGFLAIAVTALACSSSHSLIMACQDRKNHFIKKYTASAGE